MIMTKSGIALADASRKQKFLKKTWKLFRASCQTSSLRNFNHYNGKTIFFTAKHSPVFVGLVFNIGRLEIFGSLKDSVVDSRRLILSRYQYRTNKATFFIRVYREIPVNISWIQVFIAVKHLPVFFMSCFNALTLEILLSREQFYVLFDWVGGPDGKIFGPRSWRTDRA